MALGTQQLRTTKRDGSFHDIAFTSSTNLRATRRDGTAINFKFTQGKFVRATRRDGSFYDLSLGGVAHALQEIWCSTCRLYVTYCPTCDWSACGHIGSGAQCIAL